MAICILAAALSVMGWFLIPVVFSMFFIALVYGLCFGRLYALVMHSETIAPVRDIVSYRLLIAIVLHAAFPISLIVPAALFDMSKTEDKYEKTHKQ